MPQNLLSEYTIVEVARGDEIAPPFVSLTTDEDAAKAEALAWAEATFGEGDYSISRGRTVRHMQQHTW